MKSTKLVLVLDASDNKTTLSYWSNLLAVSHFSHFTIYILWIGDTEHEEFHIKKTSKLQHIYLPLPTAFNSLRILSIAEKRQYAERILDLLLLSKKFRNELTVFFFNNGNLGFLSQLLKEKIKSKIIVYFNEHAWENQTEKSHDKYFTALSVLKHDVQNNDKLSILKDENEEMIIKSADVCIYSYEYDKQIALSLYNLPLANTEVISQPFLTTVKQYNESERVKEKRKLGFSEKSTIILFYGDFEKESGVFLFLEAMQHIFPQYPDVRVIVAGKGDLETIMAVCGGYWNKLMFVGQMSTENINLLAPLVDLCIIIPLKRFKKQIFLNILQKNVPMLVSETSGITRLTDERRTVNVIPVYKYNIDEYIDVQILIGLLRGFIENSQNDRSVSIAGKYKDIDNEEIGFMVFEKILLRLRDKS